jgi:hypothetical protein
VLPTIVCANNQTFECFESEENDFIVVDCFCFHFSLFMVLLGTEHIPCYSAQLMIDVSSSEEKNPEIFAPYLPRRVKDGFFPSGANVA